MRVGIDFDNTIAGYDEVFHKAASGQGLLPPDTPVSKRAVRDTIRNRPDGDLRWQQLQGYAYGQGIHHATLFSGFRQFVQFCNNSKIPTFIVSHKTVYSHYDHTKVNLRAAAKSWMKSKGFFDPNGMKFSKDHIFFEPTRCAKINKIRDLDCTFFIDDLKEIFLEPNFPSRTKGLLFSRDRMEPNDCAYSIFQNWAEIQAHIFG